MGSALVRASRCTGPHTHTPTPGRLDMCQLCPAAAIGSRLARRNFLQLAGFGLAASLAGRAPSPRITRRYRSRRTCRHPDAALDQLMKGNARYVEGVSRRHDFKHEREPLAQGQNPFAAVLSCADSRIAPEFCFDTARGDVFVCRHAGNFADEETIASFEYGVAVLNVPLLMVLGLERLRCHRFHHQIDQGQHHPARPSAGASARADASGAGRAGQARRPPPPTPSAPTWR